MGYTCHHGMFRQQHQRQEVHHKYLDQVGDHPILLSIVARDNPLLRVTERDSEFVGDTH